MRYRIRFGITHPLPFLKNAGILARDLNVADSKKAEEFKPKFFDTVRLVQLLVPDMTVTDTGVSIAKGFGILFTLTPIP